MEKLPSELKSFDVYSYGCATHSARWPGGFALWRFGPATLYFGQVVYCLVQRYGGNHKPAALVVPRIQQSIQKQFNEGVSHSYRFCPRPQVFRLFLGERALAPT